MIRGSLQRRLFLLVVIVTITVFAVHEAIEIRSMIRAASEHIASDTRNVAAATIPLLKSTLIVDDLATAQETLDNIMRQGHFLSLRLLAPDAAQVLVEAAPLRKPSIEQAPAWFADWLNLRFAAQPFPILAGGTHYGTLVAEPSSQYLVATIWEFTWMAIVFWLATLVSALALLRFTLRRSLRPLDDLTQAAHRLGAGDLESRAPVGDVPELAETAIAFNRMADSLASARNQLEARVRQATLDLENLVTRIPVGVYKLRLSPDDSMHFDYVSPRWCELLDLDAETLQNDPSAPLARLHPDAVEGFVRDFDRAKAGLTHFQWEGRLHDGLRASWIRIEAMPTVLDNGDIVWEGIQYDISARKQAEEALSSSEEKLRGLYELSPLGIALTDMQGRYIEFNKAFRAICDYPADELMQLDYWTLTPRNYEAEEQRHLESLLRTGRYGPYEKEYLRKDGRLVPLNLNGMLVTGPDGQSRIWSIVEDITEKKRNEADLLRLNRAVSHASEAFLICDPEYRVQYINPSFEQLFGYTLAEIRGQPITLLLPDDNALATDNPVVLGEFSGERLRQAKDGRLIPVLLKVSPILSDAGVNAGFVGTMTDLTVIKTAEAALRNTLRELDTLINRIPAGVYKLRHGADGGIHFDFVSRRWCEILEISEAEVYRDPMAALTRIHPDDLDEFQRLNQASLANHIPFHWEGRLRDGMHVGWLHIESEPTRLDNGDTLWEGIQYDITAIKEREAELDRIAHYDPLTGIPNRVLLADRLHQALTLARRNGTALAVCFLDLDGFKPVNDNLGHAAGDRLLAEVARRLQATVRGGDTVARVGGDEFVLLLAGMANLDEYETTLHRILQVVSAPIPIGNHVASVSVSIGIALYPMDDADPEILLRHADQAMYEAKQTGRNKFIFFNPDQEDAARRHRVWLREIARGLANDEFELHYQPKVNMRLGRVFGLEALIRWRHPEKGLLQPKEFLPLIEDNDLIIALGGWVIDRALTQIGAWHRQGLDLSVSVNIAPRHLQQEDFLDRLQHSLAEHPDAPPGKLEIEIVDTAALADTELVAKRIDGCRFLEVHFALDDFGTGYSSLIYLKKLSVQTLKIDQSFVRDILVDHNDLAIVEGVIELAEIFDRQVIAVGVETTEHGILLLNMGCELAQGYGIAQPMPASDIDSWLRNWRPDPAWNVLGSLRWPRDDLPLVIAQSQHRAWIATVAAYVDERTVSPPEPDSALCRFGEWYDSGGRRRYGHMPEFTDIAPIHEHIHALGRELIDLCDRDQRDQARRRLPELHALRDDLLARLQRLLAAAVKHSP